MGRTIETVEPLSSPLLDGQWSMAKFYDLAKPIDGGWRLTVNLAKDGDCDVAALLELLRDQTICPPVPFSPDEHHNRTALGGCRC